jgi:integrase
MKLSWIDEFVSDWVLSGKSSTTAHAYKKSLILLLNNNKEPQLTDIKKWLSTAQSKEVCRKRAQAARAFGSWCEKVELEEFGFWKQIPVQKIDIKHQCTVIEADYKKGLSKCLTTRDTALVEMLWSTGMRRDEISQACVEHIDFVGGFIMVPSSKNGRPRIVPISPSARQALRRFISRRENGSLFGMTGNAIRLRLQRMGLPSAHAWRRGWAVHALRNGVSETSVKASAGWTSGEMVSRYTNALSGQIAVDEFARTWTNNRHP